MNIWLNVIEKLGGEEGLFARKRVNDFPELGVKKGGCSMIKISCHRYWKCFPSKTRSLKHLSCHYALRSSDKVFAKFHNNTCKVAKDADTNCCLLLFWE